MSAEHGGHGGGGDFSWQQEMQQSSETFTDPTVDIIGLFIFSGLMILGINSWQSGKGSSSHGGH